MKSETFKKYMREWHAKQRATNPEYVAENAARCKAWYREKITDPAWREKDRKRKRDKSRKSNRNPVTDADYAAAWRAQDGRCAICDMRLVPAGHNVNSACADHDHITGRFRGLLCMPHNKALGMFDDDPELLRRAMEYLHT